LLLITFSLFFRVFRVFRGFTLQEGATRRWRTGRGLLDLDAEGVGAEAVLLVEDVEQAQAEVAGDQFGGGVLDGQEAILCEAGAGRRAPRRRPPPDRRPATARVR